MHKEHECQKTYQISKFDETLLNKMNESQKLYHELHLSAGSTVVRLMLLDLFHVGPIKQRSSGMRAYLSPPVMSGTGGVRILKRNWLFNTNPNIKPYNPKYEPDNLESV